MFLDANVVIDALLEVDEHMDAALRIPDFEDALQYFSAMTEEADFIVTRNGRDFTNSTIPVLTPSQFLALMREELNK